MSFIRLLRAALLPALLLGWGGLPARDLPASPVLLSERYAKREALIPMRDGVKLFTAIYSPRDTSRTYPFLLQRTPYGVHPYGADAYPDQLGPSARFQDHRNGALWLPHAFNFMVGFGKPRPRPTTEWPNPLEHGTSDGYGWFLRLGSTGATRQYTKDVAFWNEMLDHPAYDAFWQARNPRPQIKDVTPAVLTVGGWFDAENLYGALQLFQTLGRQSPATDSRLVMGPWFHGGWERSKGDHLGPVQFGADTSGWFQAEVLFPFFLHHLKDAKGPVPPKATVFETGTNRWRQLEAWPPGTAKDRKLYLQPGGGLSFTPPLRDGGGDTFISDPAKPVPFIEQIAIGMPKEYMTADQRFAGRRPDVLVFQTGTLAEDLTLAGPLHPELFVATTGTDADWVVKLIDVYPDGFRNPDFREEGVPWDPTPNPMGGYQQLVRGEVMRGKFRDSLERPAPFVPGQPTRVAWSMNDIFHTFRRGHRVMVQIQSSWFPLMDRNPQVFMDINQARPGDYHSASHTVFHDAARPSSLGVGVWRENP